MYSSSSVPFHAIRSGWLFFPKPNSLAQGLLGLVRNAPLFKGTRSSQST